MLTIVGGTYREFCREPYWATLNGSGFRAAAALSGHVPAIEFVTCVGEDAVEDFKLICATYGVTERAQIIDETVSFYYHHPLSRPVIYPNVFAQEKTRLNEVTANNILLYGLIEADAVVHGDRVVYDPQSATPVPFRTSGSTANHLALVLNRQEALRLSGLPDATDLAEVGKYLLQAEGAEAVIIKNGAHGALVVETTGVQTVPAFKTASVWSIGSGDIFSAAFAWQWLFKEQSPAAAALLASRFTAYFCQHPYLPLPVEPGVFEELVPVQKTRKIYLAGPFFTIAERWLIQECQEKLREFGNEVFSPFHDIGLGTPHEVVPQDLTAIQQADVVFAVGDGLDSGTIFEIGYARALGKKVVVLAENVSSNDLTMLVGTDCEITNDFATAIYKASW